MTSDPAVTTRPKPRQRDDEFYINLITFEVESVLFRVPRSPFETESEAFRGMLSLPPSEASPDGNSDAKPLILHGVTAKDFRALLKALFLPNVAHCARNSLNETEWISVLRLAHLWSFDGLFKVAIEMLDTFTMSPAVKIPLAKKYCVSEWLRPAYFDLIMRLEPMTPEEADMLGIDCVLKLSQIRELRYKWIIEGRNSDPPKPTSASIYIQSLTLPTTVAGKEPKGWGVGCGEQRVAFARDIGLDPNFFAGSVEQDYADKLKQAIHDAISDILDLE